MSCKFVVYSQRGGEKVVFKSWTAACAAAVSSSMEDQTAYVIDVFALNAKGAADFGGREAVRRYEDLGSKKAIERLEVRADSLGVPS